MPILRLNAASGSRLRLATARLSTRRPAIRATLAASQQILRPRLYTTSAPLRNASSPDVFPSLLEQPGISDYLNAQQPVAVPQTLTEKIVQRHSLGLAEDKFVQSGDYVTLSPQQ
ncbi:hypothetical protein KCU96_g22065, partial [Aureobasidium melanogenum]